MTNVNITKRKGSKNERLIAQSPLIEAGKVWKALCR